MATGQGLDAQWGQWAQHRGHVETSASPYLGEPPPAAKPDQTYRATIISRRVVGDNGWSQQLAASTVYCTLVQAGSGWLVDHVDLSTPGAT
jgi:hypothetical protein